MNNKILYSADDIKVLKGLDAVRKRPSMYIGDVGVKGLHHLLNEVIDNSIDEFLAGYGNTIDVILEKDNFITVKDNGRGIPVDYHANEKKSALEVVMTVLHAGGKFNQKIYKVSGGLHGVGISCVNALSSSLIVTVHRNKCKYLQEYKRGIPQSDVNNLGYSDYNGTVIRFMPDKDIFNNIDWNYKIIFNRLQELSFLNKKLKINIENKKDNLPKTSLISSNGLYDFILFVDKKQHIIDNPLCINTKSNNIDIDIALLYNNSSYENIFSYVNNIKTIEGGTHVSGFKRGLTRSLKNYIEKYNFLKNVKINITSDDYREGLTAILSIKLTDPQFEGQTKTKLGNNNVLGIIDIVTYNKLSIFLEENPKQAKNIINKIIMSATARQAARKARELIQKKNILTNCIIPGKLADCIDNNPENCEIFLVEGDSAGGTAKQGRNKNNQAILPLKGKILNVEKAAEHKIYDNDEIKNIFNSLGISINIKNNKELNINKIRYHKIIIMTDADVDGSHINTLILTFFFRYMKDIIDKGYLYIACPPLYSVYIGKIRKYCWNETELKNVIQYYNNKNKNISNIQRYKGLGEMNYDQLWDTTMNPNTRFLKRIQINDFNITNRTFSTLMGSLVSPRRKFIENNACNANIDI